jgi:hypothetical protein
MSVTTTAKKRSKRGAALTEFAAAFMVLVVFFFVPLVNLSFIGVRFFITQGAVQEFAHRLALAEKRSDSYATLASDTWWSDFSSKCGVNVTAKNLDLLVNAADGSQTRLHSGQHVPTTLLPGGAKAPCIYTYDLSVTISVPPIYSGGGPAIPGLFAPLTFNFDGRSAWENLSRDPATTEYFINE